MDDGPMGPQRDTLDACPHINRNDQRCGSRFCIGRLDQAFSVCFGSFNACPMYHRINSELSRCRSGARAAAINRIVTLTANGNRLRLRATGS